MPSRCLSLRQPCVSPISALTRHGGITAATDPVSTTRWPAYNLIVLKMLMLVNEVDYQWSGWMITETKRHSVHINVLWTVYCWWLLQTQSLSVKPESLETHQRVSSVSEELPELTAVCTIFASEFFSCIIDATSQSEFLYRSEVTC